MNAPVPAGHMAQAELEYIPVAAIRPSGTPIQALRRARFDPEKLLELAASIKEAGVIEPIIVRPITPDGHVKYELVAGERRWLATDRAGLAHVPAIVRNLTAAQVLTTQLIENKQRDDYTPLEEGQGYKDLMDLDQLDAGQVGTMIGKSRAYVYARRKLLDLCPEAREALQKGLIDTSKALLLARVPGDKLQAKGLALLTETNWRGEPVSYKEAFGKLRDKCMQSLAGAPFALDDHTLCRVEKTPGRRGDETRIPLFSCNACPHYSRNDIELQLDLGDADVCTHVPCYEAKLVWVTLKRKADAAAAGTPVLSGEDAKKIAPRKDSLVGYVDLDAPCEWDECEEKEPPYSVDDKGGETPEHRAWEARCEAYQPRTYRQLLGDQKLDITLLEDPKTKRVRELVPIKVVRQLLAKQHEIKLPGYVGAPEPKRAPSAPAVDYAQKQRERDEREARELAWRHRVMAAIAAKCAGPLKREDLIDVADMLAEEHRVTKGLKQVYGGKMPEPSSLKDPDLGKFIRLALVAQCCGWGGSQPGPLLGLAKRYKIDVAKIKAAIAKEEKGKAKAEKTADEKKGGKK